MRSIDTGGPPFVKTIISLLCCQNVKDIKKDNFKIIGLKTCSSSLTANIYIYED